ncbi:peptide-methionine (S)-S-oxide reductase MsrA [Stakelama sp. CBK3Z-3]|uniref:Peptide methionine sulfoxide reductase MsrA n=1 Tax=Stakelama flava TaxID=2860338 RepID=A0ABS6XKL6_9SPHN|nr:peptide-methionine (S)-S-oxide reductase MsrA [Stakelama flava]MBW4330752.1 peptide-methionine (S)-S-oxide reductase MsrA [Stakelama flava]
MTRFLLPLAGAGALGIALLATTIPGYAEKAVAIPAASYHMNQPHGMQTAVLAGGCFWGMEAVFEQVKGVRSVVDGYAGGTRATATYAQVSTERTGHAEAVKITYDPAQVSYATLLRVYFSVAHDPTQKDRQYPDRGPSYRSAIFPQNQAQKQVAARYIRQLGAAHVYDKPIVTRIERGQFYPAEAYHQDFYRRNPNHPYIVRWDKPKMAAFRKAFPALAKG